MTMRRIAPLLLLVVVLSGYTYANEPDSSQKHKQQAESTTQPPVLGPQLHAQRDKSAGQRKPDEEKQKKVIFYIFGEPGFFKAVSPETWSSWALVIVAIVGAWVAIKTINAIKRQADLQQAQMVQWIEIKNWKALLRDDTNSSLIIDLEVSNPTNFPIKILKFWIRIAGDFEKEESPFPVDFLLTPHAPQGIKVNIEISKAESTQFTVLPNLLLNVSILATYVDMGPNEVSEMLNGGMLCALSNCG